MHVNERRSLSELCAPSLLITPFPTNHKLLICNQRLLQMGLNDDHHHHVVKNTQLAPQFIFYRGTSLCLFDRCYSGRLCHWLSWDEGKWDKNKCFCECQELTEQSFLLPVKKASKKDRLPSAANWGRWRDFTADVLPSDLLLRHKDEKKVVIIQKKQ